MTSPISGFGEMIAVSLWVQHLGGFDRLRGFQAEGRSEFVRAASEPLPPPPPLAVPRVLAREEAPSYIEHAPEESRSFLAWMCFYPENESRVLAHDLDLVSALMFLTRADTEREYAIERDAAGRYLIISGEAGSVMNAGDLLLHTHRDGIALPSGYDLKVTEERPEIWGRNWSMIYSSPPDEHQLAFVHRVLPRSFDVYFWRDRLDRERGERRTSARNFRLRVVPDPERGGDEFENGSLEVLERSLEERTIGSWTFGPDSGGDIQDFWKGVLG
jgi:hypothetical protein